MKKNIFLYLCLIICLQVVWAGSPRLQLDSTVIRLGKIALGDSKNFKITLKNTGDDKLRIIKIQPSCGCTTAKMPKDIIAPGKSDAVELKFNSAGLKGHIQKHVQIETNDPVEPKRKLTFVADIVSDFEIVKYGSTIFLGTRTIGREYQEKIGLYNVSGRTLQIKRVTTPSSNTHVKADKKKVAAGDTLWVEVKFTPVKEGYRNEQFVVETNNKFIPTTSVRFNYNSVASKTE